MFGLYFSLIIKSNTMTNVEKLKIIGILEEVRLVLGAKDGADPSFDFRINNLGNSELIAKYTQWELSDGGWWRILKGKFDQLEELDQQ